MSEKTGDDTAPQQEAEPTPAFTRSEWENVPIDPDPTDELGYEWGELDIITAADDKEKLVVLPEDEEMIREDAFIILSEDCLYDVVNKR